MPVVTTRQQPIAHRQIDFLSTEILSRDKKPLYEAGVISDETLERYGIQRILFDFEILLEDEAVNLSLDPPVLFQPLPLSTLQKHPLTPENLALPGEMDFREYDPPRDADEDALLRWSPYQCAREVHRFLKGWSGDFSRSGIETLDLCQLRPIEIPNPFFLGRHTCDLRPPMRSNWSSIPLYEACPENENEDHTTPSPHVIEMTTLCCNGKEDSLQFGELASIIATIDNRRKQPISYGEEDEENMFENYAENRIEIRRRQCVFEREKRFPVLMISLLGPQHGRLFYACMDGEKLMIRQSKLYSFERKDTAPLDFFTRFILSRPLEESSNNASLSCHSTTSRVSKKNT